MPTYVYEGRDNDGKLIKGRRLAQTAESLSVILMKEGITPINIVQAKAEVGLWQQIKDVFHGKHVSVDELSIFARQMYSLTKTGVPITSALKQLAETARTVRMSDALNDIVERLESGQDLASAMDQHREIFSPMMISMIRVGQSGGHLDEAFMRLNQYLELEGAAIKRASTALRYPLFIFIAIVAAVILINIFVIPTFANMFAVSKVPLPAVTKLLIGISDFFRDYWYLLVFFFGGASIGIYYYLKSPQGKISWGYAQFKLPIIGPILRRIVLLRFAQSFSVVVNSGIPLLEGIRLVADTVTNPYAREEILSMQESVLHGRSLTQAVAAAHLFTPLELQMLMVSEETGELGKLLEQVANFYSREVDFDLKRLSDIIEPLLIVGLAIVILVLALAVYLPIWNMVKMVHT